MVYHLQSVTFVSKSIVRNCFGLFVMDYTFLKNKNLVLDYQEKPSFPFLFIRVKAWMVILPTILHNGIKPFFLSTSLFSTCRRRQVQSRLQTCMCGGSNSITAEPPTQ